VNTLRRQVQNLTVFKIDEARQLVYVKGHVPGNNGGFVRISDAIKGPAFPGGEDAAFPFPTHFADESKTSGEGERVAVRYAPPPEVDPLKPVEE